MFEIDQHQLAYHPTKGCHFRFRVKGTTEWTKWVKVSASDLAALAAVLNESPVYYNKQTGSIFTGEEPTGE